MKNLTAISVIIALTLGMGCGNKNSGAGANTGKGLSSGATAAINNANGSSEPEAQFASRTSTLVRDAGVGPGMTPLERVLAQWQRGDRAGAVNQFLQIDWATNQVTFVPGSPLSIREKDLAAMSAADRERVVAQAMFQLKDLRELASAVREKGAASAISDPDLARRCFTKLSECGAALERPDGLKILQLTAVSIRKLGTDTSPRAVQ